MRKFLMLSIMVLIMGIPFIGHAITSVDLSSFQTKLTGENIEDRVRSVASAGDVNNDGINDLIIGTMGNDTAGVNAGAVYIIYGSASLASSIDLGAADVKLVGENEGDYAGYAVSSTGDVNNDSINDVIIGALSNDSGGSGAGAVYIIYGSASLASSIDLGAADVKLVGENADDNAGFSVASANDINGDGINDIIVGANNNGAGGEGAGAVYIIYGSASLASSIDLGAADVKLVGENAGDEAGYSISTGDFNNDALNDIIIGAIYEGTGGSSAGAAYIIYGSASLASAIDLGAADVKLVGEDGSDYAGWSVSAGDVNNDNFADAIIGAQNADLTYIIYGSASLASSIDLSIADVKLVGEEAGDASGFSVAAGDVNNDSISDVIVGAYAEDTGGSSAGAAYIIYGSASLASAIDLGDADVKLVGENAGDEAGYSVAVSDVNNDGINDAIIDAIEEDTGALDAGAVYLGYLYADVDGDGVAGDTGLLAGTDCNDEDVTVSEDQTYYQDADGDGLGNLDEPAAVCSMTAPDGYVEDFTDLNDAVKDISTVEGITNGDLLITYVNSDTATVDVFGGTATKETVVSSFNDKYYVALSSNGKKTALVDVDNLEVVSRKTLATRARSTNDLTIAEMRSKDFAVVTSKKKAKVLLSLVQINVTTEKLTVKDNARITDANIKPAKTKVHNNTIYLRNASSTTLASYLVTRLLNLRAL